MSELAPWRLRLLKHLVTRFEASGSGGKDALFVTSERRQLKLEGSGLRAFEEAVLPLLDGYHTVEEIAAGVGDRIAREDMDRCLRLLVEHGLVADAAAAALDEELGRALAPQSHYLHELGVDPAVVYGQLERATVAVVGLGALGTTVALALAAAGVGTIRCVDELPVAAADRCLGPALAEALVGVRRVEAVAGRIAALSASTRVVSRPEPLGSDADVLAAIEGTDFVVACLDPGQASLVDRLNRACLEARLP